MCIVSLWLQVLLKAGEEKFGTDEQTFVTILGNRSAEHLRKGSYAGLRVAKDKIMYRYSLMEPVWTFFSV